MVVEEGEAVVRRGAFQADQIVSHRSSVVDLHGRRTGGGPDGGGGGGGGLGGPG